MSFWRTTFPVGRFQCNCSIIADLEAGEAIVIDPGDEVPKILEALNDKSLKVRAIVHTHAHLDHIGGTAELCEHTQAQSFLHPEDQMLHNLLPQQAMLLGLPLPKYGPIDQELTDGGAISFGKFELGTLHTPGHSPGSVCFTVPGQDLCFSGDTLFRNSIGRTDLWGGDADTIKKSIQQKLYHLPNAVQVITGHGPETSIEFEKTTNPFVRYLA